ncbi:MAG: molybdenum cofactor guanylyltransferase [Bacteroidetes bacterium]|nr:molybdenum cofactor guanylyltransferase [Bacteroidota bacterium]
MGTDKGLLVVDGKRIVERIAETLKPLVDEIIIITNGNNYDYLGYQTHNDLIKDCGPMGGIYTALSFSKTEKNFVVSCDMPFITKELVQLIIENSGDSDIAIPMHHEKLEPLCAVYDKRCQPKLGELLRDKEWKLQEALKHFKVKQILVPETVLKTNCFANINTPSEFEALKSSKNEYSN